MISNLISSLVIAGIGLLILVTLIGFNKPIIFLFGSAKFSSFITGFILLCAGFIGIIYTLKTNGH